LAALQIEMTAMKKRCETAKPKLEITEQRYQTAMRRRTNGTQYKLTRLERLEMATMAVQLETTRAETVTTMNETAAMPVHF
jgi:hypothetical protein